MRGSGTMKLVRKLLNKPEPTPTWDIKPASERPEPRTKQAEERVKTPTTVSAKESVDTDPFSDKALNESFGNESLNETPAEEKNPWLDDEMLDTIKLEADDLDGGDFYQTSTWEQDFENDTRRLKTIPVGTGTEKKATNPFNPYDTGSMRRGWKK